MHHCSSYHKKKGKQGHVNEGGTRHKNHEYKKMHIIFYIIPKENERKIDVVRNVRRILCKDADG